MVHKHAEFRAVKTGFRLSRRKIITVALTCIYVSLFIFIYIRWGTIYHYMGLSYSPDSTFLLASAIMMILFYVVLSRFVINDSVTFFVEFQFFVILVPSLLIVSMQAPPTALRIGAIITLFSSQLLLKAIASIKVRKKIKLPKNEGSETFLFLFLAVCALMTFYIVINYLPYMRLVAFSEVHAHRLFVGEAVQIPLGGYIIGFLQNAASPLFVAIGIFTRNRFYLFIGIALAILVYSIFGAKIAIAQVIMTIIFGLIVRHYNRVDINFALFGLVGLLLIVLITLMLTSFAPHGFALELAAVIFMRSFAIQGAMTGVYLDFFSTNPLTWYSHVNIVNQLITYPYDAPLGFIIGNTLGGSWNFNANASFWATDGIAALGLFGIPLIAFIVGVFLLFTKLFITKDLAPIAATASIPFIMALGNASFFTNLITGGGILLFVLLRLVSRMERH